MKLHQGAREFFRLVITTTPAVEDDEAWELSVDGGVTWTAGEVDGDALQWLIAGPAYVAPGGDTRAFSVITASLRPLVRLVDNPETIIDDAPMVYLQR